MNNFSKSIKIFIVVIILTLLGVGTITYSDQYTDFEKYTDYLFWDRQNISAKIRNAKPAYVPDNIKLDHTGMPYYYDDKKTEERLVIGKRVMGGESQDGDRPVYRELKRIFYYVIDASYAHLEPEIWEYRVLGRDSVIENKQEFTITIDDVTYHVVEGITPYTEDGEKNEETHYGVKWETDELKYSLYTISIDFEELRKILASF